MTTSSPDLVTSAAAAAAQALPSVDPFTVGTPVAGDDRVADGYAGAATAELDGPTPGRLVVLVGSDLVDALAASPLGGLDLAAATQPAFDAAASALGATARAAEAVDLALVVATMSGPFTVVPLVGTGTGAALLMSDPAPADAERPAPAFQAVGDAPAASSSAPAPYAIETVASGPVRGIEMLHGVDMEVTVELGRTRMTVRDLLALSPGAVLELDRAAGSPADLLVNGRLIARGEVVVVDEDFGLRVTEIVEDAAAS